MRRNYIFINVLIKNFACKPFEVKECFIMKLQEPANSNKDDRHQLVSFGIKYPWDEDYLVTMEAWIWDIIDEVIESAKVTRENFFKDAYAQYWQDKTRYEYSYQESFQAYVVLKYLEWYDFNNGYVNDNLYLSRTHMVFTYPTIELRDGLSLTFNVNLEK